MANSGLAQGRLDGQASPATSPAHHPWGWAPRALLGDRIWQTSSKPAFGCGPMPSLGQAFLQARATPNQQRTQASWLAKPQHHSPPFPSRLQGLLTLFAKSFASFNHSTCALSVPSRYSALRWIHLALQTAVPSHSTPGCRQQHPGRPPHTVVYRTVSFSRGPFQVASWCNGRPGQPPPAP